jgi:hypothetical protein
VNKISLAADTVAERVSDVSELRDSLKITGKDFEVYSIAIDEGTDAKDFAKLALFIIGKCKR